MELLGVGRRKETDVHKSVKKRSFGMFNYRLKWKNIRFPNPNLSFLLRIQVF